MIGLRSVWVEMVRSREDGELIQRVWEFRWLSQFGGLILISGIYKGLLEDLPYERIWD